MVNLKRFFQPVPQPVFASTALLVIHLIAGVAFTIHGWGKIQHAFIWMGPDAPVPAFLQFLAAFSEFGGGIAWILGLLTPLASLGILCTMSVAVHMHMIVRGDPFVNLTGGLSYEPALGYWGVALLILALGPGKFSMDKKIFGGR